MEIREDGLTLSNSKLDSACWDLKNLLRASVELETSLKKMDKKLDSYGQSLSTASRRVAPLQSLAITAKALDTRINRAVSPALALLNSFKLSESLQRELLQLSSKSSNEKSSKKRLRRLKQYVDCVDKLNEVINSISHDCEPAIQKLQEVLEFLSRTKATDQYRIHRLTETLITLKALYETEVEAMRFDGLLDEALLKLQDEYEAILLQLKYQNTGEAQVNDDADAAEQMVASDLGTELEIEVLGKISETLAVNDCLDICIEIFVKVRYKWAAKALMRLKPDYLLTYKAEEINAMEWENLEMAITLWTRHFEVAVKTILVSEKRLCHQLLGEIMEGLIWNQCFVKIAGKITNVFFRFSEGVANSSKEPQKLFKLLDMFDSLEKMKAEFYEVFEGEAGADICRRYRELEKLVIHGASKVFWEFGIQIKGNQDRTPPPPDGSIPKLVRYAINYLKYLATDTYRAPMGRVLKTEHTWKAGILSKPESEENLLANAVTNSMEAIVTYAEAKRTRYKDKVLPHVFAMNTYWYIYMRTRNTELEKLLGEQYMKKRCKMVAEESAFMYQKQVWEPLVRLLDKEEVKRVNKEATGNLVKRKIEGFMNGFREIAQKHRGTYSILDGDLREQIKESTVKLVVSAYKEFLNAYATVLPGKYKQPEEIEGMLRRTFEDGDPMETDGKAMVRRRSLNDQTEEGRSESGEQSRDVKEIRRFKSNAS